MINTNHDLYCPECGKETLGNIETCEDNKEHRKTAWCCDCSDNIVYIYEFKNIDD